MRGDGAKYLKFIQMTEGKVLLRDPPRWTDDDKCQRTERERPQTMQAPPLHKCPCSSHINLPNGPFESRGVGRVEGEEDKTPIDGIY